MTDMPHVDRFVCTEREDGTPTMEHRELGGWVRHEDWEKAQKEIIALRQRLQKYEPPVRSCLGADEVRKIESALEELRFGKQKDGDIAGANGVQDIIALLEHARVAAAS